MSDLAQRLDYLFATVHPPGRGPYSYTEAAEEITKVTGKPVTHTTLWKLRTGKQDNPHLNTLKAIAEFFKVPLSYFTDDKIAEEVIRELEALKLLRDSNLTTGHLRALSGLPDEAKRHIVELINSTLRMEESRRKDPPGPNR